MRVRFEGLVSQKNLLLAWRRIRTGQNLSYKHYFRRVYDAYEVGLEHNIKDLHERLIGRSYIPKPANRIYVPKVSGLQRPITLLSIEDQIVYQAIANIFAMKLSGWIKRAKTKGALSCRLQRKADSIFFLVDWRLSYREFVNRLKSDFQKGYTWIAHFDLAAFYDTICHELLMKTAFPSGRESKSEQLAKACLKMWSSDTYAHQHGIPQGPIASSFLAECFLLPVDKRMGKDFRYVRYVDDIRIFGRSKDKVEKGTMSLELACRERGLIPQGKKYAIVQAKSVRRDVLGRLPSIPDAGRGRDDTGFRLGAKEGVRKFRASLKGKPYRISDKSLARHVLYSGEPSSKLLSLVLTLLPRHPEHIDAFVYYFSHYKYSTRIVRACLNTLKTTPYQHVQGELWHVLARMTEGRASKALCKRAMKSTTHGDATLDLRWGACHYLLKAEKYGVGVYRKKVVRFAGPLVNAQLVSLLPDGAYVKNDVVGRLLRGPSYEAGVVIAEQLIKRELTHRDFGLHARDLPSQVQNVFRAVGIIRRRGLVVDPMGEILHRRYGIEQWSGFRRFFKDKYVHSLGILSDGDAVYESAPSEWLSSQNSFNHALFIRLQKHLTEKNLPGIVRMVNRNEVALNFGQFLDPNNAFSRNYPNVADGFRAVNVRRNTLPRNHPYDFRGGGNNRYLDHKERNCLRKKLEDSYKGVMALIRTS